MSKLGFLEMVLNANGFYLSKGVFVSRNPADKLLGSVRRCSAELETAVYSIVDYRPVGDMSSLSISDSREFINLYSMVSEHLIFFSLLAGDRQLTYSLAEKAVKFSSVDADKDAYRHHLLGIGFLRIENFRDAKFEFEQSLLADGNNPHGNVLLGICYEHLNEVEKAKQKYEGALKCSLGICRIPQPDDIDYLRHYSLGMFHYKKENYKDAARSFEECIRLSPNDSSLYARVSFCYESIGKFSDALQCVRYGLIRCPEKSALSSLVKKLSQIV